MSEQVVEEDMVPLTPLEFMLAMYEKAVTGEETDEHDWAVRMASMVGVVSLNHESLSKDAIVRALQEMAIHVPETVLEESSDQLEEVQKNLALLS